jgi:iron complex outermembrane receptor protein
VSNTEFPARLSGLRSVAFVPQALAFALLALPALAHAQQKLDTIPVREGEPPKESATELDTIEVTGSRIRRSDYETAQPIQIISRLDIESTGITSIGELLERLPFAGSGGLNTAVNNGGNGSELLDLRYLGPQRVLVLVNGRRWVNRLEAFGGSGGVDLTTIPIGVVERIEILKDGASAVYGTDAIAGVVNLITRKDFQGAELGAQLATFEGNMDEATMTFDVSWGSFFGKDTSAFVNLQYMNQDPVFAGDRDISKDASPGTGVLFFGSSSTPQGRFRFSPPPSGSTPATIPAGCTEPADPDPSDPASLRGSCNIRVVPGTDGESTDNFETFTNAHRYNFGPINYLLTPSERTSLYVQAKHTLPWDMELSGDVLYSIRESVQQLAEVPLNGGNASTSGPVSRSVYIAVDNPYNQFGYDIGLDDGGDNVASAPGQFFRRLTEVGPRIFSQEVTTLHVSSALTGDKDVNFLMPGLLRWEAGGVFSTSKLDEGNANLVSLVNARTALGPVADCESTPGCVPLNLLGGQGVGGSGTITRAMADYISYDGTGSAKQELTNFFANTTFPLYPLPAGDLAVGFGIEVRDEKLNKQPDLLVQQGFSSTNREEPTQGKLTANEAYVEFAVPVLSRMFMAETLELNLAARYSDYSRFDAATSAKAAIKYQPIQDLMVRTSWSEAFRAPSVGELFQGLADNFPSVTDPCSDRNNPDRDDEENIAAVRANCDADGIPDDYVIANSQILSPRGGNALLEPETAESLTAGFIYSPRYLDGFEIVVDWFNITLDDGISVLGAQDILDRCYGSTQRDAEACSRIERAAPGDILSVLDAYLNLSKIEIEGVDVGASYRFSIADWGNFGAGTDWTYLTRYAETTLDQNGQPLTIESQGQGAGLSANAISYPRWKGNLQLTWGIGNWNVLFRTRAIQGQIDGCQVPPLVGMPELCSDPDHDRNEIDWTFYNDVQFAYDMAGTALVLGADNVFDQDPPANYDTSSPGFDTLTYDIPGIAPYLRVRMKF